jgi:hypothetical protein
MKNSFKIHEIFLTIFFTSFDESTDLLLAIAFLILLWFSSSSYISWSLLLTKNRVPISDAGDREGGGGGGGGGGGEMEEWEKEKKKKKWSMWEDGSRGEEREKKGVRGVREWREEGWKEEW